MKTARFIRWSVLTSLLCTFACSLTSTDDNEITVIRVWSHQGQEAENQAVREMAEAFNLAHADEGIRVDLDFFPDYQYTEKLSIAAAGGDLPDVFDLDGPTVAQFADAGLLLPLYPFFTEEALQDFQPAILEQGTYKNQLVALGSFDSAMVLYGDTSLLKKAGIVPPPPRHSWSWEQFVSVLRQLKAAGIQPLSMHMDITGDEWFTYAFTPLIWSNGGRLISGDGRRVEGVLNSAQNVESLKKWQALFEEGLVRRSPVNPNPFGSGKVALDWTGHWMAKKHVQAKGEDLAAWPLPRTGPQQSATSGSWCWAVSSHSPHPEAAAKWLHWVVDPVTGIQPMVQANGALPSRASAYALLPEFQQPPYDTFRYLQENHARARPRTPVYPTLTRAFAAAMRDIAGGADVDERLTRAEVEVQGHLDRLEGVTQ